MTEACYRSGQAAKEMGVSSYEIRRLCEAGLIDAEFTAGKQWRIPAGEIARLKREGVPPIPSPAGPERPNAAPPAQRAADHGLLAPASENLIEADEGVAITERQLKKRKTELELEEVEDRFREREEREAQRLGAAERADAECRLKAEAERRRQEWTDRWIEHALRSAPYDAPAEVRLDIQQHVDSALGKLRPDQPDWTVQRIVEAAVEKALAPWRRSKEVRAAIEDAIDDLPWAMRADPTWKARAIQAAGEAIARLRQGAGAAEMQAAAAVALRPPAAEFEHQQRCNETIEGVWRLVPGGNAQEWADGKDALREALAALPIGATPRQFEAACQTALEPIRATIAERQDRATRKDVIRWASLPWGLSAEAKQEALDEIREALDALPQGTPRPELEKARDRVVQRYREEHERKEQKARLIEAGLREIYPYLQKLEKEWKFDKSTWALEEELKPPVREALEEELDGDESAEEVARLVRRLVREELRL